MLDSVHALSTTTLDGRHVVINAVPGASSLAMYINDCVSLHRRYSVQELLRIHQNELELELLPGCSYNAQTQIEGSKRFAVAVRDIQKDEELFFEYGRYATGNNRRV